MADIVTAGSIKISYAIQRRIGFGYDISFYDYKGRTLVTDFIPNDEALLKDYIARIEHKFIKALKGKLNNA